MWGQEENNETEVAQASSAQSILEPVKTITQIDDKLNNLYNNIVGNLNTTSTYNSTIQNIEVKEMSQQLNSFRKDIVQEEDMSDDQLVNNDIEKLLGAADSDILGNLGEISVPSERKQRYQFYEEMPNINFIAYRMLKVYLDNILIKNVQSKQFININNNPHNTAFLQTVNAGIGKHYENLLKTVIVFFDLQKKLKNRIVPDLLKYGNAFIEILNLQKVSDIASKTELITESSINPSCTTDITYGIFEAIGFDEYKDTSVDTSELNPSKQFADILKNSNIEESSFYDDITRDESEYNFDDINKLDFDSIKNIYLKNISPNQVIIVEEDGILYGYLAVEEIKDASGTEVDIFKRFTQQETSRSSAGEEEIRKTVIDNMTKGIVKKVNSAILGSHSKNLNALDLGENISSSIKIILYHKIKEKAKLKFRFISPTNMVNFTGPIDKFGPYGTSIFDPIIQPVKMYTLALMSSIVSRLSRASVVRKWTIEAGNKKNHAEIIEKVKKDISNKSISFDSLSNVKNISKVITDFRDLATIQVNGQRFIDMEVMPMGDRALPMNDMQDLRNELIAATGIPSVYLNIGDQVDLRETLVNLNISFATTISSYQSNIDESLNHLINSIFGIILENNGFDKNDFALSNYYHLSLNPPLVLTVQANEALISSVTNIIGMLKSAEIIIDPSELLKLYIPQMNWDDLLKTGDSFIKTQAKEQLIAQTEDPQ